MIWKLFAVWLIPRNLRGIEPGPINTYPGWQALNRNVKKGEKAVWLCMPLTRKITDEQTAESQTVATNFVWKPRWFVLSQTEGDPSEPTTSPAWSKELALAALGITETPFTETDGNVQGYAKGREVSVSPLAAIPHKTLFHEIAHIDWATRQRATVQTPARRPEASEKQRPRPWRCCFANRSNSPEPNTLAATFNRGCAAM